MRPHSLHWVILSEKAHDILGEVAHVLCNHKGHVTEVVLLVEFEGAQLGLGPSVVLSGGKLVFGSNKESDRHFLDVGEVNEGRGRLAIDVFVL